MFMVLRARAFVYRVCYLRIQEDILPHPLHRRLLVASAEVNQLVSQVNWICSIESVFTNIIGRHSESTHYKRNLYDAHSPGKAMYTLHLLGILFSKPSSFGTWRHGGDRSSSMFFFSSRGPVLYSLQFNPSANLVPCATGCLTFSSV